MEPRNAADLAEQLMTASKKGWSTLTLTPGTYSLEAPLTWPALTNITIDAGGVILKKTTDAPGPALLTPGWKNVQCVGLTIVGSDSEEKTLALVKATNAKGSEPTAHQIGCAWQLVEPQAVQLIRISTSETNVGLVLVQSQGAKLDQCTHAGHWTGKYPKLTADNVLDKVAKDLARTCYGLKILGGINVTVSAHHAYDAGGAIVAGSSDDAGKYGLPKGLRLLDCRGARLGDNGIYISSGEAATVEQARYLDVYFGHAAKARGSGHALTNSTAERCHAGFALEPLGQADAVGGVIARNRLTGVTTNPIGTDDWPTTTADGKPVTYRVHDVEIVANELVDCNLAPRPARAKPTAPVRPTYCVYLSGGDNVRVAGNTLRNCGGTAWLNYAAEDYPWGLTIEQNELYDAPLEILLGPFALRAHATARLSVRKRGELNRALPAGATA